MLHGVDTIEFISGPVAVETSPTAVIGLVGTALITLAFLVKFRPSQLREAKES